ncbi:MAG: helix-turn-helix domain-containing protein [Oscillospiraceae bacterium]|jgi:transcriptional regulator with XRE-family HTH domain|nr:helix-turn-helix domain-containing protein [Oscillospiraceae bacterium]
MDMGKTLAALRKAKETTQDEMAAAIGVTPQAISKWETGVNLPDTEMVPQLAEYFGVSTDFLFTGEDSRNLTDAVNRHVMANGQFQGFGAGIELFGYMHHALSSNNLLLNNAYNDSGKLQDDVTFISSNEGFSTFTNLGFGIIAERDFFKNISDATVDLACEKILPTLAVADNYKVILRVLAMDDVSYTELLEQLAWDDGRLRATLDALITSGLLTETASKHKALGSTYHIAEPDEVRTHMLLCAITSVLGAHERSFPVFGCCAGYGDFPINS